MSKDNLNKKFDEEMKKARKDLEEASKEESLYRKEPSYIRNGYMIIGCSKSELKKIIKEQAELKELKKAS